MTGEDKSYIWHSIVDEDQGERFDRGWNADQADDSDPDYDPNILETYR